MSFDFPYVILCRSAELRVRLFHLFIQWVEKTNLRLDEDGLERIEMTDYKKEELQGLVNVESLVSSSSGVVTFSKENIREPLLIDGISLKIPDDGDYGVPGELSLVFIDQPGSMYHGVSVMPYKSKDKPGQILLEHSAFHLEYEYAWYQTLLHIIASIDEQIRVFCSSSENVLASVLTGTFNSLPPVYLGKVDEKLDALTEDYLRRQRDWAKIFPNTVEDDESCRWDWADKA